mgnify:CR=1 FL=1
MRPLRTETDELGGRHVRYQQFYRGVPVEHGIVTAHAVGSELRTVSGEVYQPGAHLRTQPTLTAAAARKRALEAVGATRYMWQDAREEAGLRHRTHNPQATYFPAGELVLLADRRAPAPATGPVPLRLAWKFNVYAKQPISRSVYYIDAHSGAVVLRDNVIKHVNATGTMATRYSGTKTGSADQFAGGFRLRETVHGRGVTTLNCEQGTSFAAAVDFIDNDNNWTAAEHDNSFFDNAALDAHLGAAATQDYWTTKHGRDSYDNRGTVLLSFVHFDVAFDNAFWDGTEMVYGDGGSLFRPLTAVDVCGHEIGHAVCETTAGLIYQDESGALNEGFSDIWGACVEHHYDPTKQTWLVGEDIALLWPALRSMSDPNSRNDPDTYQGDFWEFGPNDHGGVHTNSGVFNFWFYLLSQGGAGANDFNTPYLVPGIGIEKGGKIAYRAESVYMTPNTDYRDALRTTLQSAVDLYGLSSPEVTSVAQAWRAVGLNDGSAPAITSFAATSGARGSLVTINGQQFSTAFRVTFNGVNATACTYVSATQIQVEVPPTATTGPISLTTTDGTATTTTPFTVTGTGAVPTLLSFSPVPGAPQGATVTIAGTNLTGATAVSFNGAAATFTVVNATTITATVPATATTGPLRVTTPGGRATAAAPFLVLPAIVTLAPASGAVGATVAITGTSFTGALVVKFNGTYANFTVVSPTRITATVPVGATTGPVTVRTPSGTATSPAPFTVTPTIAVTDFSPASGPPLTTVVTVYGVGFTGATAVRFNNTPATTFTVASDTELWATVPAGATTGPIRVTSPVGTASSANSFSVLIPGAPQILTFFPDMGPVGTTVTLEGIDFASATSVQFNGTPTTIVTRTSTRLVVTVPAGATTGQISVTSPLGTGVTATPFRVLVPPTNDLCSATNLPVLTCGSTLIGTTLGAGNAGDPTAANSCGTSIDGPGVFYKFVGTGQAVAVDLCGPTTNYDAKLHVFSGACGTFTCLGGDDDACGGGSGSRVTFASVTGTTYLLFVSGWSGNTGDFEITATCATAPPPTPTIAGFVPTSGPVGTSVTLNGSNLASVTAVRFGALAATSFTVNAAGTQLTAVVPGGAGYAPIALTTTGGGSTASTGSFCTTYAAMATGASRCGTGTVTLTATGAPTGATYRWYTTATGGTPIAGASGATFTTPSLTTTTTYYVAARTSGGCEGPRRAVAATINAAPTAAITAGGATTFCVGGSVALTATGGGAGATYQFRRNGSAIAGATAATYSATQAGNYSVVATSGAGCAATPAALAVTVNPAPATPTITATPQPTGTVLLTSSAATGNQWYRNAVLIAGATARTYLVGSGAQNGAYTVRSTSAAGCASALSAAVTTNVVGTAEEVAAATLTLYPNPTPDGRLTIELAATPDARPLLVLDAAGREVLRTVVPAQATRYELDAQRLARGVYAVRIGSAVRRLVRE